MYGKKYYKKWFTFRLKQCIIDYQNGGYYMSKASLEVLKKAAEIQNEEKVMKFKILYFSNRIMN